MASEVYVMTPTDAAVFVDITDTFDRKIEALLSHTSQMPDPAGTAERSGPRWQASAEAGRARAGAGLA